MEQYVSKSAVIAEIKKLRTKWDNPFCTTTCDAIEEIINTFKVKKVDLTWQDIKDIAEIGNDFMNSEESDDLNDEEYYIGILTRFLAKKGGEL